MNPNLFAALACAFVTLASSELQAQLNPQLPPPPPLAAQPQFGPCYPIVIQNRGVAIDLKAAATSPTSIALTWSGFAGAYEVTSSGPGAAFRGSMTLGPATLARDPSSTSLSRGAGNLAPAPQVFPGNMTHATASSASQYSYTIIGTLADGRKACGQATATTPPAPEKPVRTRPLAPPVQTAGTLTVVTVNIANAFALGGNITWEVKMDRLAAQIAASREVPDIISMTESSGWTSCSTPASDNSGDYDMVDRLIWRLRDGIGVTYRLAYMVGAEGAFGWGRCHYYSGDTVLYNPNRITNLTPADVAGRAQVAHNYNLLGFLVRRSLPLCNRGARTNLPNLEQLIDGPPQTDKCNRPTPSAPAWAWQEQMPDGSFGLTATLARFGLVGVPNSSFDVVTTHPKSVQELLHQAAISRFIAALTGPAYRKTNPYYPTVVLGDFNCLVGPGPYDTCPGEESAKPTTPWPAGTTQVFTVPQDVMAVALGTTASPLAPLRSLRVLAATTLPAQQPCRPSKEETQMDYFADRSFSDHCGLLVRFSE
jgi:hypothetical protein